MPAARCTACALRASAPNAWADVLRARAAAPPVSYRLVSLYLLKQRGVDLAPHALRDHFLFHERRTY